MIVKKLALLLTLCACATVPVARNDLDERAKLSPPSGGAASVFVYRPHSIAGSAVTIQVTVDEVRVGWLAPGTFTRLTLRPGEHKLVVTAVGHVEQTIVVEGGRSYFVKVGPAWGWGGANASAELLSDERAAREEIAGCALIADPAADAIRRVAEGISGAMIDPLPSGSLVAVAALELAPSGTARGAPELEAAITALRATRPGMTDGEIVFAAVRAMAATVRPGATHKRLALARAIDERLGLVIRLVGHDVLISGVLPDSPAALAGIDPGTELREVNGQSVRDHAPPEVLRLLDGATSADVALTLGGGDGGERHVVLHRAVAGTPPVECRILDARVLYLRPWNLLPTAARRVRDDARSVGTANALVILDLRDATAGTVEGVRDLVDSFLAEGKIVSLVDARNPEANRTYAATPGTSGLEQAWLVVLVNGNTAGVAEAAAAAVQDQRRGTVLGSRTAGEGVVGAYQDISGVRVWVPFARLIRASGERIDGRGVEPDVVDASAAPVPVAQTSDVACPHTVSRTPVASDPLVRRAVELLHSTAVR
jgi:carboxyl-terminal processing protease